MYSTNLGSPFPGCLIPGNRLSLNFSCYLLVRMRGVANISTVCPVWGNKLLREHGLQQQQPLSALLSLSTQLWFSSLKRFPEWTTEMAQCVRPLPEDWGRSPAHTWRLTTASDSSSRGSDTLFLTPSFWPLWALHTHSMQKHACRQNTHTYIQLNK